MNPYRIAHPGEFIFKRDSAGVETVEHGGLVFATMAGPGHIEAVDPLSDDRPSDLMVDAAIAKAKTAGFWSNGTPAATMSPVAVTVQVEP